MIFPRIIAGNGDYVNGDLFIPKNAIVTTRLISFDERKEQLLHPYEFNPDRFDASEETPVAALHAFEYIPFSAGPRNCIGQHMAMIESKLIVLHIIENYEIRVAKDYNLKIKEQVLLSPVDNFMVEIKRKVGNKGFL